MMRALVVLLIALLVVPCSAPDAPAQTTSRPASSRLRPHAPVLETNFGATLLRMVLILAAVCLLAYVAIRFGLRRLAGAPERGQVIEVLARQAIEPRRSIVVVRVGTRTLVLGSSEAGLSTLASLSPEESRAMWEDEAATTDFATALERTAPPDDEVELELEPPHEDAT